MPASHSIGTVIRTFRESRDYSQDYMADMLGISQSAYANLENGKSVLSIDRLIRISDVLELDIHDVIDNSLEKNFRSKPDGLKYQRNYLHSDTREAYDQLIRELRNEVRFLRSLIRKEHA